MWNLFVQFTILIENRLALFLKVKLVSVLKLESIPRENGKFGKANSQDQNTY
jgi:hypothetical protein